MAQPRKPPSVELVVKVPKPLNTYIEQMVRLGIWGSTRQEIVLRLMGDKTEQLLRDKLLQLPASDEQSTT